MFEGYFRLLGGLVCKKIHRALLATCENENGREKSEEADFCSRVTSSSSLTKET